MIINRHMYKHNYTFITSSLRSKFILGSEIHKVYPTIHFETTAIFSGEKTKEITIIYSSAQRGGKLVNTHSWQVAWKAICNPGQVPTAVVKTHAPRGDESLAAPIALSQQACWCLVSAVSGQRVTCWTPSYFLLNGSVSENLIPALRPRLAH